MVHWSQPCRGYGTGSLLRSGEDRGAPRGDRGLDTGLMCLGEVAQQPNRRSLGLRILEGSRGLGLIVTEFV